jgi:uncharacterized protein (TIGR02145 family)
MLSKVLFFNVLFLPICSVAQYTATITPTESKQSGAPKQAAPPASSSIGKATIKVTSNAACTFYLDGELSGTIAEDEILKVYLPVGDYIFKAVSTDNKADVFKQDYHVTKEELNTQLLYRIKLAEIIVKRREKEQQSIEMAKREEEQKVAAKLQAERKAAIAAVQADIDRNYVYKSVQIGSQTWMAENLRTGTYRNGEPIELVTDNNDWKNLNTGAYCSYDNTRNNASVYGYLYNWYAVSDPRGLCPNGWHVPSDSEWQKLIEYLGGGDKAGGKLKSPKLWKSPNTDADNIYDFSGIPGGWRHYSGTFYYITEYSYWWGATSESTFIAWYYRLSYYGGSVYRYGLSKRDGLSVRCIKD